MCCNGHWVFHRINLHEYCTGKCVCAMPLNVDASQNVICIFTNYVFPLYHVLKNKNKCSCYNGGRSFQSLFKK